MKNNTVEVEKFWRAVMLLDYETVRNAIANGFDVNKRIPGKVPPITFAQTAEDMIMLKILWEAGAHPATPWLEAVFRDFTKGGNGSKYKTKPAKKVGEIILHRFNGDEKFELGEALIQIEKVGKKYSITLIANTNGKVIQGLPDTRDLPAQPSAQINVLTKISDPENLTGEKFSLPSSFDKQNKDYVSTIYYLEHEPLEANEIEVTAKKKHKYFIKWSGKTKDVNYYDGSKPDTLVMITGWFKIET
jgi:hypothetical protein